MLSMIGTFELGLTIPRSKGLFLLLLAMSPCGCATTQLWQSLKTSCNPSELLQVSVTNDNLLHMAIRYGDRRTYRVLADLRDQRPAREKSANKWFQVEARLMGLFEGDLPATARRIMIARTPSDFWHERDLLRQGDNQAIVVSLSDSSIALDDPCKGPDYYLSVLVPAVPVVWSDFRPIGTVLATPVTATLDLVTLPFQAIVLAIFLSSGDLL